MEGRERFGVTVRYPRELRSDPQQIAREVLIPTMDGAMIPLGNKPVNLGAWEKLQLGWLEYDVAQAGERSRHRLGPAATTDFPQAIVVNLPDKVVVIDNGEPHDGERFYQSPQQENRDDRMAREFDLPAGATLSAYVRYQLEQDWDYAYVVVSNDGGATWTNLDTNLSTDDDPNGQNAGHG